MTRRVFKYKVRYPSGNTINMPVGAKIVHFGEVGTEMFFWAEVDTSAPLETRRFSIVGTGHEIGADMVHVGTVITPPFVWHLYEYTGQK